MFYQLFYPQTISRACLYYYFTFICMQFRANPLIAYCARILKYFTRKNQIFYDNLGAFKHCCAKTHMQQSKRVIFDFLLLQISPAQMRLHIAQMNQIKRFFSTHHASLKERIRMSLKLLGIKHKRFYSLASRYGELRLPCLHPFLMDALDVSKVRA